MPPWLYLGSVIILAGIVAVMAVRNTHREKGLAAQTLFEKGTAFIRAFESGARTGMGMHWEGEQYQVLLEEMAKQPDILYLAVTNEAGVILADSDKGQIGSRLHSPEEMRELEIGAKEKWRMTTLPGGRKAFEVYRYFEPLAGCDALDSCDANGQPVSCPWSGPSASQGTGKQAVFTAFDVASFDAALAEDMRNTVILSAILLLLGVGGVMTLFWAQSYRFSKRQLQDTRVFSSEIINNLPVGLITTDSDGRLAVVNGAAERISGVKAADIVGKSPEEALPAAWCGLKDVIGKGEPVLEHDMECSFNGGKNIPLSLSASKILNEEGRYLGNLFIFRDLGEVRRLQEEVRRKEKLAALGSLAAGVAHEIRNPLSSIKGFAKYFEGQCAEGSHGRELAAVMAQEVDRLNRVITELLDFARSSDLKARPMDVGGLIEHSLRLVRQDAEGKKITVAFDRDASLPVIAIDPDRLTQALLNLYLNAIQAMEGGGTLAVRASSDGRGGVRIEVEDSGKGITPESLSSIFNPYFTTKSSGTGLGLAIVQKIIEAHRGEVKVKSTPGRGTTFNILLPVGRPEGAFHGRKA
ncbi:ATP-binding protein [Desulfovibrio sp. TomC]|uniref:ATP-binding protein n=1 Tax=Desulfovibrio sp. TomC TaxID=1562888 RepID=UPI001E5D9477|nr:ATP-binding protein [Desulfovibrio sp. TomC]